MEIRPKQPSARGGHDLFTGDVWIDVVVRGEGRPGSASASSASRPARGMPGTPTPSDRRCTSPMALAGFSLAAPR